MELEDACLGRTEMMRLAFAAMSVVALPATVVCAQDITPDGIARSVSLFSAIAHYCPSYTKVDPEQARKFVKAYMEVGAKVEGAVAFKVRLENETVRRSKEVEITAPSQWCERQKAFLQSKGEKTVFP